MAYRDATEETVEVYDWDIVMMHGTVRVMGMSVAHVRGRAAEESDPGCSCGREPRTSSPIVCPDTRRVLEESWYSDEPTTGEARHLLGVGDGDEVTVGSGKVYRLVGSRKVNGYPGFSEGSIFRVYPLEDEMERQSESWWTKVRRVLRLAS